VTGAIPHAMTTTSLSIDGYRSTRTLGIVRGITVRSRSVLGTIGASLQTLVGGNITLLTELCEKAREEAFDLMLQHAQQMRTPSSRSAMTRPRSCRG
jgi:uncharacterized protein YbjQ (UPF0145 family)